MCAKSRSTHDGNSEHQNLYQYITRYVYNSNDRNGNIETLLVRPCCQSFKVLKSTTYRRSDNTYVSVVKNSQSLKVKCVSLVQQRQVRDTQYLKVGKCNDSLHTDPTNSGSERGNNTVCGVNKRDSTGIWDSLGVVHTDTNTLGQVSYILTTSGDPSFAGQDSASTSSNIDFSPRNLNDQVHVFDLG